MKKKKWNVSGNDLVNLDYKALGVSKLTAYALSSKGYDTTKLAMSFLEQKQVKLLDPFLLRDMQKAIDIINEVLAKNGKIVVYGDYDVDGITSSVILTKYLAKIGANVIYYIPDRASEGYGLNKPALENLVNDGADLIITVDCGITAVAEVAFVKSLGAKIIVTDHHSCKDEIPDADALVNPKHPDCKYPYKELAGVGVAFKLICAHSNDIEQSLKDYGDIVALGTIADVMPLTEENRTIVSFGVDKLKTTENIGLKALFKEANIREVSSSAVGFKIAPRLNAAGRMGKAVSASELLLSTDESKASELALMLCEQNFDRRDEEHEILTTVLAKIEDEVDVTTDKIIVVAGEHFHHGVVGIVSSRVTEKYYLPSIILSVEENMAKGSARSVEAFNIFENLCKVEHLLEKFGGHKIAAGLSVTTENIEPLRNELLKIANETLTEDDLTPKLYVDAEVLFSDISLESVSSLDRLEPYGVENPEPVFISTDVKISNLSSLSGGKHLKFTFEQDGQRLDGLFFGKSPAEFLYKIGDTIDIAYTLNINDFNGRRSVQLLLKDYRSSAFSYTNEQNSIELYNKYKQGDDLSEEERIRLKPNKDDFGIIYKLLRNSPRNFNIKDHARSLSLPICKYLVALDCFKDANLCEFNFLGEIVSLKLLEYKNKVVLEETATYKNLERS